MGTGQGKMAVRWDREGGGGRKNIDEYIRIRAKKNTGSYSRVGKGEAVKMWIYYLEFEEVECMFIGE
jgi:hypothetical protein